jgi:hypothetical protein
VRELRLEVEALRKMVADAEAKKLTPSQLPSLEPDEDDMFGKNGIRTPKARAGGGAEMDEEGLSQAAEAARREAEGRAARDIAAYQVAAPLGNRNESCVRGLMNFSR